MEDALAGHDADRMVEEAYDRIADTYDEGYTSAMHQAENVAIRRILIQTVLQDIPSFPHPGEDGFMPIVLDVGCGTGLLLDIFPELTPWTIGVDVSEKMLEKARQKHPEGTFLQANMADLADFDSGAYAAVVSLFGPLSFCSDFRRASREIKRVLAPGGRFFVMACGTRYATRESYRQRGYRMPMTYYTADALRNIFHWARTHTTRPFNVRVEDRHAHKSVDEQVDVLLDEWNSRMRADAGYQVVIHGQK